MKIIRFEHPTEFREVVWDFLCQKEAQNCLIFGILDTLVRRPETYPEFYLWVMFDADQIVGAAWMTPPHPLGLSEMPEGALTLLMQEVQQISHRPCSVLVPKFQSDLFSRQWKNDARQRSASLVWSSRCAKGLRIRIEVQVACSLKQTNECLFPEVRILRSHLTRALTALLVACGSGTHGAFRALSLCLPG